MAIHTQRHLMPSVYIPRQVHLETRDPSGSLTFAVDWYYTDELFPDGYRYVLCQIPPNVEVASVDLIFYPTQRWILVSEIGFYGTVVPGPSSFLALISLNGIAAMAARVRKQPNVRIRQSGNFQMQGPLSSPEMPIKDALPTPNAQ